MYGSPWDVRIFYKVADPSQSRLDHPSTGNIVRLVTSVVSNLRILQVKDSGGKAER